jgi:hypothetical protein
MAQGKDTGHGECGARGGCGGQGGQARNTSSNVPRKASELGACKNLEGHIFTIGSGNMGKYGDMLCTFREKMATYIETKYGDVVAQEWTSKKCTVLAEPTYSSAIETRHAERVRATREQLNCKMTSLMAEQNKILKEVTTQPTNSNLMKERREIEDQILKCEIDLKMRLR